jgi:hypothetical protein
MQKLIICNKKDFASFKIITTRSLLCKGFTFNLYIFLHFILRNIAGLILMKIISTYIQNRLYFKK